MTERTEANETSQEPLRKLKTDLFSSSYDNPAQPQALLTSPHFPYTPYGCSPIDENTPQNDESWTKYFKDQRNILFIFEQEFDPILEKHIDLSSNRWFDILALNGLLFQTQVNASSTDSELLAKDSKTQLILLKFICAHGPCVNHDISSVKKAYYLAQREIIELRRLLKQAFLKDDEIYYLYDKISDYHSWCLRNGLINKKDCETIKRFAEQESMKTTYSDGVQPQRQSKESRRQTDEVQKIYRGIQKNLDDLVSQLNKKSFYYINILFEDLYSLIFQTNEPPNQKEVLDLKDAICKNIEDLVESFYRNVLEQSYTEKEEERVFGITKLTELKLMRYNEETNLKELWRDLSFLRCAFISRLRTVLRLKLPDNDDTDQFLYYLLSDPYSFLRSKMFSHVNWPLLYALLSLYESNAQQQLTMPKPELTILTGDLRLTFYSKDFEGALEKEIIPIHLENVEAKLQGLDENKIQKLLVSAMSVNDKETYKDDLQLMEIELLRFLEANIPKIMSPKVKELNAKYNETFEVGEVDIIVYSTTQYQSPEAQDLLLRIYLKIEDFLSKNFKIVNLRTKSCVRHYCFSFKRNEDAPTISKGELKTKLTKVMSEPEQKTKEKERSFFEDLRAEQKNWEIKKMSKQKVMTTEKMQSLVESSMISQDLCISSEYSEVKSKRKLTKSIDGSKQKTTGKYRSFFKDLTGKKRNKRKIMIEEEGERLSAMPGQNLCFNYEFLERIVLYRSFNLPVRTYFVSDNAINEDEERILKARAKTMKKTQALLSKSHSLKVL